MPLNGPILGTFYNKDLFAQAGLPVDTPAETWDDLREYAKKLTVPEKDQWGFAVYEYGTREFNLTWMMTFIWAAGGKFWKDDYTGVAIDSPEAVEALQFLVDLIYQDKTLLPPGVPKEGLVESNKIGIWVQGNWGMKFYAKAAPDLNYGTALVPRYRTHGQYVSSDGLLIPEPAKNKDLGWKLIEFLLRPDVNTELNLRDSFLPVHKDAWTQPPLSTDPRWFAFVEGIKIGRPLPNSEYFAELVESYITPEFQAAFHKKKSPAEALSDAARKANEFWKTKGGNKDMVRILE